MAEPSNPPASEQPLPTVDGTETDPVAKKAGQDINPWSVSGEVGEDGKVKAIDYKKLTSEFGTTLIDDALLERWERVTGVKPHRFMRRQIVFSHRDLNAILDRYEKVIFCPFLRRWRSKQATNTVLERAVLPVHWSRAQQ